MILIKPTIEKLPDYAAALQKGWSPDNLRPEAAQEILANVVRDPAAFVSGQDDPSAIAGPVILPNGSKVPRLPGLTRWIWKNGFCGQIGLRWTHGTEDLPPTCSGHIGYAVVPWRRNEGLATAALFGILPIAKAVGLSYVAVTTNADNAASQRVIEKAGGRLQNTFVSHPSLGGSLTHEFRILLA